MDTKCHTADMPTAEHGDGAGGIDVLVRGAVVVLHDDPAIEHDGPGTGRGLKSIIPPTHCSECLCLLDFDGNLFLSLCHVDKNK